MIIAKFLEESAIKKFRTAMVKNNCFFQFNKTLKLV